MSNGKHTCIGLASIRPTAASMVIRPARRWDTNISHTLPCNSLDNMKLSIFGPFGLKTHIHAPKLFFWGNFTPKMGSNINKTPKRHILVRVHVDWAIKRENPSMGLTCRWVLRKRYKWKFFRYILPICPEVPYGQIHTKLGTATGWPM